MVVLVDSNRAVKISIREWDEENTQYRPDWSADFFEPGRTNPWNRGLKHPVSMVPRRVWNRP